MRDNKPPQGQMERPILFNALMVRAILAGRKNQTRRIITPQPIQHGTNGTPAGGAARFRTKGWFDWKLNHNISPEAFPAWYPYGRCGDRLYVKEALKRCGKWAFYDLDGTAVQIGNHDQKWRWKNAKLPARFMPKDYSRITLEITKIRVERLQEISEEDADKAEGMSTLPASDWRATWWETFAQYWDDLNGAGAWDKNPWVWVLEFTRVESEAGSVPKPNSYPASFYHKSCAASE